MGTAEELEYKICLPDVGSEDCVVSRSNVVDNRYVY